MKNSIILSDISLVYDLNKKFKNTLKKNIINTLIDKNIYNEKIFALKKINLKIEENSVVGLYGPNGSGKTSLLKILAKITDPTDGSLEVPYNSNFIGSTDFNFIDDATGEENTKLFLKLKKIKDSEINEKIQNIFEISKIGNFFYQPVKIYSSGMKMRLAFASTQMIKSDLLLMDEWISAADQSMREYIYTTIHDKIESSKITIIASHNHEILKSNCSQIIYLKNGEIENIKSI